jgi:hypothetical protein
LANDYDAAVSPWGGSGIVDEEREVTIALNRAEALVLFDLLRRWAQGGDDAAIVIEQQAEQRVLWDILASLEQRLVAPFSIDYASLLAAARQKVQDDR